MQMPAVSEIDLFNYWMDRLIEFDIRHEGETDPEQLQKVDLFREVYLRRIRDMEAEK